MINLPTETLSYQEVSDMRVKSIKRRLARTHGFGADELSRILDKKELIEALAFEEHKIRQIELTAYKRDLTWNAIYTTIALGLLTLFWPLFKHLYEVALVNFVVYTDRKKYEAKRCWDYRSLEGAFVVILMAILDILQIWLTASVMLSWVMTSKYFFPIPSISIRPAALMGGPVSQGPLAQYGFNVGPMVITWLLRFIHGLLEGWVGRALVRSHKRQKKQKRDLETPEEKATRKAAKRAAKQREKEEELRRRQWHQRRQQQEPEIKELTPEEIDELAAQAALRRRANVESNTAFDDLD